MYNSYANVGPRGMCCKHTFGCPDCPDLTWYCTVFMQQPMQCLSCTSTTIDVVTRAERGSATSIRKNRRTLSSIISQASTFLEYAVFFAHPMFLPFTQFITEVERTQYVLLFPHKRAQNYAYWYQRIMLISWPKQRSPYSSQSQGDYKNPVVHSYILFPNALITCHWLLAHGFN